MRKVFPGGRRRVIECVKSHMQDAGLEEVSGVVRILICTGEVFICGGGHSVRSTRNLLNYL